MVNDATGDFADLGDLPQDYDISLEDTGLKLNLGGLGDEPTDEEAKPRPVTEHDIAELRRVEAELLKRWGETEIDPTLDRVRLVMDYLGEPQTSFRSIHVAGTNGKTSTTRMIESLLRAFGHRVGSTTSPHLQLITERIGIDGAPIHPAQFVAIYDQVAPYM